MGLAVVVGILADQKVNDPEGYDLFRDQFRLMNILLAKNGLPSHAEPEDIPVFSCDMFGYSGLHYVRRIAAHLCVNRTVPEPCEGNPTEDPAFTAWYDQFGSSWPWRQSRLSRFEHLMHHSDADGYYLPQEFKRVQRDPGSIGVHGELVGSSIRLLQECERVAEAIGLPTSEAPDDELLWNVADEQGKGTGWRRYGIESYSCTYLLAAAKHSIEYGAAICFV